MKRILFLCTKNSCRSQMAEGWARHLYPASFEVGSAGSSPSSVDPRAKEVMAEVGIDLSSHHSKSLDEFREIPVDYVFTVCGAAHDRCPLWTDGTPVRHHGFDDPPALAKEEGTAEAMMQPYRRVRDEIGAWIQSLREELAPNGQ